jgi:flagellar hook-length control protein FliK
MIAENRNTAELILHPKELGKMSLSLIVQNDKMEGRFIVESENAKSLLLSDMSSLKEELKTIGVELDFINVDVRQNSEEFARNFVKEDNSGDASNSGNGKIGINEDPMSSMVYIPDPDKLIDIQA